MSNYNLLLLKAGDRVRLISTNPYSGINPGDVVTVETAPVDGPYGIPTFSVRRADGALVTGCSPTKDFWTLAPVLIAKRVRDDAAVNKPELDNSKNNPFDGRAYRNSKSPALRRIGTIVRLHKSGKSIRQIADKLDLTKSSVHRALHTAGDVAVCADLGILKRKAA